MAGHEGGPNKILMDPRKHKVYAGSQVLAALVFFQTASIPQLVNSPGMLHFATHALFGYQVLLSLLILLPILSRPWPAKPLGRPSEMSTPKLFTLTNTLTALVLSVSMWAAALAGYRFGLMLASTGLLLSLTLVLYRRNLRHWKRNYVYNIGPGA